MANFCKHCGGKIEQGEQFCGNCGAKLGTVQAAPASVYSGAPASPLPTEPAEAQKAKKSINKKAVFIGGGIGVAAIAAILIVLFLVILPGGSDSGSDYTQNTTFNIGGTEYYAAYGLVKNSGDPSFVMLTGEEEKYAFIDVLRSARVGNTFYCGRTGVGPDYCFVRSTINGDGTATESKWISDEVILESSFIQEYNSAGGNLGTSDARMWLATASMNFYADGDYIYFNLKPDHEHAINQGYLTDNIVRVPLDGSRIERVGDLMAADMVISDGWIYYFDDGFCPSDKGTIGPSDESRVGIYKARTDGSGAALIRRLSVSDEQKTNSYGGYSVCGDMRIIDGKLYYLDYTEEGRGRICRMALDGSGIEYLSENAAHYYAYDRDHNAMYYIASSYDRNKRYERFWQTNEKYECCRYDIASGAEQSWLIYSAGTLYGAGYRNGYVYYLDTSNRQYSEYEYIRGMRLNTSTNQCELLLWHDDTTYEWITDPATGRPKHEKIEGDRYLYWVPVENER